jgi:hypothetical protein
VGRALGSLVVPLSPAESRAALLGTTPARAAPRSFCDADQIFCVTGVLSASSLTYFMRRVDSDLVVFCFANSEDVEAFAKQHFGGERFPRGSRRRP